VKFLRADRGFEGKAQEVPPVEKLEDYIPEKPESNDVLSQRPDDRAVISTDYDRLYYFYGV
jgi:hypothetical protein